MNEKELRIAELKEEIKYCDDHIHFLLYEWGKIRREQPADIEEQKKIYQRIYDGYYFQRQDAEEELKQLESDPDIKPIEDSDEDENDDED